MTGPPRADSAVVQTLLEEDAEEAYEHAPAGYVSTLPDGTILKVNATFCTMTGLSALALVGRRRFQDLLSVPGRIYYETHLGPLLAMQGSLNEIAVDIPLPDASPLRAIMHAAQKRTDAGEPVLNRFTVFSAIDRRRYEQQLLEAQRAAQAAAAAKTELLAMLSHDIRTPLGSIMAAAELLERPGVDPQQEIALRILKSSAAAILALVEEVLEHSRLEAGVLIVRADPLDLRALLEELVAGFQPLADSKSVALECAIDPKLPAAVVGDRVKLGQVVGNLVGNAMKFTKRGSVRLSLDVLELQAGTAKLRVAVADTGIGIAQDELPHIFAKYSQAHGEIAPRYGGVGLGLAIARKLLQAHGTDLQVKSKPGEGSEFCFEILLPLP